MRKLSKKISDARMWHICYLRESGESFVEIGKLFNRSNDRVSQIFKKGQRISNNIVRRSTVFDEPRCRKKGGESMTPRQLYESDELSRRLKKERDATVEKYKQECLKYGYTSFDEKRDLFTKYFM